MSQGALWAPESSKVPKRRHLHGRGVLFALGPVNGGLSWSGKLLAAAWVQRGGQQPQLCGRQPGGQILGATWEGSEWLHKCATAAGVLQLQHGAFRGQGLMGFWPQRRVHGDSRGQAGRGRWHRETCTALQVEHRGSPPGSQQTSPKVLGPFPMKRAMNPHIAHTRLLLPKGTCSATGWFRLQRCGVWLITARSSGLELTARKTNLLRHPLFVSPCNVQSDACKTPEIESTSSQTSHWAMGYFHP